MPVYSKRGLSLNEKSERHVFNRNALHDIYYVVCCSRNLRNSCDSKRRRIENLQQDRKLSLGSAPVSNPANSGVRSASVAVLKCPDDPFNMVPYVRNQVTGDATNIYARGNYAMNWGPGQRCIEEIETPCHDGFHVDNPDLLRKNTSYWGSGAGGASRLPFAVPLHRLRDHDGSSPVLLNGTGGARPIFCH